MFKRILSALISRVSARDDSAGVPIEEKKQDGEQLITAYDPYGREIKIARSEWRDKVFLPQIQKKWDEADGLYSLIVSGLDDGFAADLRAAAEHLLQIDSIPERGYTTLGIVLLETGELEAAEVVLREGMKKVGETAILLTNLAKVFSDRGNQDLAEQTLWKAVQADPNEENGLRCWVAIQQERGGDIAYLQAMQTAADLHQSWRAKLWLARHYLEHQEIEAARKLYTTVLARDSLDGKALTMISGDLGSNGQIALIPELIAPVYDEHKHDPFAGINLLRAYKELGKTDEGTALINRMYALGFAPIKQQLDQFASAFQKMQHQAVQSMPLDVDGLKIITIAVDQPLWQYGLQNANWLFSQKSRGSPEVGFFSLAKVSDGTAHAESQREDDLGRLTRAIPLYLAEAAHYWTDYVGISFFLMVEGRGPVLSTGNADDSALFDIVPEGMKYFVTGKLGSTGAQQTIQWHLALTLWNCSTRSKQSSESGIASMADLGSLVLSLENRLLRHMGLNRPLPLDAFYRRPDADMMSAYLTELGQAFMLTMLAREQIPKSAIWGERAMLDWSLAMALHAPQADVPKLMYLSNLGKAWEYQSDVLSEYRDRSLQLLRDAKQAGSPIARMAPLVWKIFDMRKELEASASSHDSDADSAYGNWLARVLG